MNAMAFVKSSQRRKPRATSSMRMFETANQPRMSPTDAVVLRAMTAMAIAMTKNSPPATPARKVTETTSIQNRPSTPWVEPRRLARRNNKAVNQLRTIAVTTADEANPARNLAPSTRPRLGSHSGRFSTVPELYSAPTNDAAHRWDGTDQIRERTRYIVCRHRVTRVRPSEAIFEDRGAMMPFPPVAPDPSWRYATGLSRDHYIRVDTNDYPVNPRFVGRRVEVTVTLDEVVVTCDGTEVARHRRVLAKHQTLLVADHARVLRRIRAEAAEPKPIEVTVEERDLEVYDQIFEVAS